MGCLSWGFLEYFLLAITVGHYKTSNVRRKHSSALSNFLWQSTWLFCPRGREDRCFHAQLELCY